MGETEIAGPARVPAAAADAATPRCGRRSHWMPERVSVPADGARRRHLCVLA